MVSDFLIMFFLLACGQLLVWLQVNGQFKWDWFKNNEFWVVVLFSMPAAYFYIKAQAVGYEMANGSIWALRLIGFGIGIICFSVYTWLFTGEIITIKTAICLLLAITILIIQMAWK